MDRFQGLIGIILILGIAFLCSNNKKKINYRLVVSGLALQVTIAILVLKVPIVTDFFKWVGSQIGHIEAFAKEGAAFVYGGVIVQGGPTGITTYRSPQTFIFAFSVTATIILVCALVAIFYHWGIMQDRKSVV